MKKCQICEETTEKPHENALDCIQAYQERLRVVPAGPSIMDALREWRDPSDAWKGDSPMSDPMIGTILGFMGTALSVGIGMAVAGALYPKRKRRR